MLDSIKTTLNIPDERMAALLEATEAKTRTEAINKAIEDYIHRENVKKVMALAGTGRLHFARRTHGAART